MPGLAESSHQQRFRFGEFEFDPLTRELRTNGRLISLQEQPFQILTALLERPGQLVTRNELTKQLWPAGTFVDFEHSLNTAINRLREVLEDSAEHPRFIETMPRRGYRFVAPVTTTGPDVPVQVRSASYASDPQKIPQDNGVAVLETSVRAGRRAKIFAAVTAILIAILVTAAVSYFHHTPKLTEKDSIVLADFTNATGDPVFEPALRQGLSVQLEQSPFLSLVSDEQVQQTLRMMGQPPTARLTPQIAREVCQRTSSAVVLHGSIAQIGLQYNVILKAVNCATGTVLASTEAKAADKNHVLDALSKAGSEIRTKLGESLSSVQKYDTPIWQATTPSLEALRSFSLAQRTLLETNDDAAALPFAQRAVELDSNFALAHAVISGWYWDLGETTKSAESGKKAFELRSGVSENERLFIEGNYYLLVTGDLVKARQIFEIGARTFPRDPFFPNFLGPISICLGEYERSLKESREGLRLVPWSAVGYGNIIFSYLSLNRIKEAQATADEAHRKGFDSPDDFYLLSFLQHDQVGMARQVAGSAGTQKEDWFLAREADTAAFFGQLGRARELSRRATDFADRSERKETAATYIAVSALREALFGNSAHALRQANSALERSSGRDVEYGAALALAYAGDRARVHALANDLNKRFPDDTIVQFNYLPTLRAKLELSQNHPERAEEILRASQPYELGSPATYEWTTLYPVYVRGESYLAARRGQEASTEFQKILDQPGIVLNEPIGVLARLQLARAYAMQGDKAKAKAGYQDFLTSWRRADPDLPILKQAKAAYARLSGYRRPTTAY